MGCTTPRPRRKVRDRTLRPIELRLTSTLLKTVTWGEGEGEGEGESESEGEGEGGGSRAEARKAPVGAQVKSSQVKPSQVKPM